MKAQVIKILVQDIHKLERAVPPVSIVTANVTFQVKGDLSAIEGPEITAESRKTKLEEMIRKALWEFTLD